MGIRRLSGTLALATALLGTTMSTSAAVAQDDDPMYYLPAPAGTELFVSAGNDEPDGRRAGEVYAFDFVAGDDLGDDFPVLASRGGTVIATRTGVRNGRCDEPLDGPRPSCWRQVNFVLIDHGDGTSGLYMHLRPGVSVERGEIVSVGTRLGRAGRTGWTDETGVQFQVQETPPEDARGKGGWFVTRSEPIEFADEDVIDQTFDGVPETGDFVISSNPGAHRDPFRFERRPLDLPAVVPFEAREERDIIRSYDPDDPDGYGLTIGTDRRAFRRTDDSDDTDDPDATDADATDEPLAPGSLLEGTAVRPIFSGDLVYAGCGTDTSASLGLMVVIARDLDEGTFYGVHGHLSDVDPALLEADLSFPPSIDANDTIGHYGGIPSAADDLCLDADPDETDLFVGILRDADVSEDGAVSGGTPISPEPLLGRGAYEEFEWWPGPIESRVVDDVPGRPRGNWHRRASAHASHIPFGQDVELVARVRDRADIHEVRFRAYYPNWARRNAVARIPGFDPKETWRLLAVCRPPGASGEPRRSRGCDWDGDEGDAIVSYSWDPSEPETTPAAPWLPRARVAIAQGQPGCVPVSLAIEVIDASGHVRSALEDLPTPDRCDQRSANRSDGRVVYLDPLVPPAAPGLRGELFEGAAPDRGWPPVYGPDPLDGAIIWRDRSDNEDGFHIYARSSWFVPDCSLEHSSWQLITSVPPDTQRYRPNHNRVYRSLPQVSLPDVPGSISRWEYAVASYNEAGVSRLLPVGGFVGGSEAFCDPGIEEPGP